jgi:hypothetical protein
MIQLAFTPFCAFAIAGVHYGTGQHAVDIHPSSNIPIGLKVSLDRAVPFNSGNQLRLPAVVVGM